MSGKEMLRFLQRQGFNVTHIRGSHHHLEKGSRQTVVPVHGNRSLKKGTFQGILRDIKMRTEEFIRFWQER